MVPFVLHRLHRLPVHAGGIALNIVAMAGLAQQLARVYPDVAMLEPVRRFLVYESVVLMVVCLLRALCSFERVDDTVQWRASLWAELRSMRVVASHCALLVAIQLGGWQIFQLTEEYNSVISGAAAAVIYIAAACNWLLSIYFLVLAYCRRASVEPFWFPPTVSLCTLAIVGDTLSAPFWLTRVCLVSGFFMFAVLWPVGVVRALRHPQRVAPDPSVFILMAPVPFVTLAMFACRPRPDEPLLGAEGRIFFFFLNNANALIAFFCAFQRRHVLRRSLCPLSPAWASITFPLVSNCTAAVFYAAEYALPSPPA